ncbi:MAG: iron ABC transporter permease [Thalassospira sp.]|uniref:FecCD family ABC transporter permease n=1 Tax=Thalassospira sp. TaxID=1912094 RepID=UPI0032ECAB73
MTSTVATAHNRFNGQPALWGALVAGTFLLALASLTIGRYDVPLEKVIAILAHHVLPIDAEWKDVEQRVVELIRIPRMLQAVLVGASLALSGAALQGAFRNPLIGPQIVGVSSGAALGGATAIFLSLGTVAVVGSAFVTGVLAMVCVYMIARTEGRAPILMLVLSGVIVSAFCTSMTSMVTFFANPEDSLPAIVYWLMGSFATASYDKVAILLTALLVAGVPLLALRFRINVLSLGDEEAEALGIKVERTRWIALLAIAALVAASVSVSGIVGWVGLVVPHFARMLFGPDHRLVLPASMIMGAAYMMVIDNIARTMTASEIPLGVLTAIVGAPVFGWLLRRTRARGW